MNLPQLDERELTTLRLTARGMAGYEMSRLMALSEPRISTALTTARRKLRATTTSQAVVKALKLGILKLEEL